MNRTLFILILICLSIVCLNGFAQFMPMQSTMSTPRGNISVTNYVYSPRYYGYGSNGSAEHSFKITFSDSTQKIVKGSIVPDSPSSYIRWIDKSVGRRDSGRVKKTYPSQTISLTRIDGTYGDYAGISADSCWLFKSIKGRIKVYTSIAEDEDMITDGHILYIQKEDGPLLAMNEANLEEMLKSNDKAYAFFKKKKYLKAINKYNNPY